MLILLSHLTSGDYYSGLYSTFVVTLEDVFFTLHCRLIYSRTMSPFNDNGFPVIQLANDGWSTDKEATATCFCGAVQLVLVSVPIFASS